MRGGSTWGGCLIAGQFLAGALVGVVVGWVADPAPLPAEEIADQFWQLAEAVYRR